MNHSFNVEIACMLGMTKAVILENINFWICHNKANQKNFIDGKYWTYNSARAYKELFPYLSESSIQKSLKQLIADGYLLKGNYNKIGFDRTGWYAFTEKTEILFKTKNPQQEAETSSEDKQIIPQKKNTVKTSDTKLIDDHFEEVWALYPKKSNKKQANTKTTKEKLFKIPVQDIKVAIDTYKRFVIRERQRGFDLQYQNGGRWFTSTIDEYLPKNINYDVSPETIKEDTLEYTEENIKKYVSVENEMDDNVEVDF